MRQLTEAEIIALNGLLKLENDAFAYGKAVKELILDEDFKPLFESSISQNKARIEGLLQFINENAVTEHQHEHDEKSKEAHQHGENSR